MTEVGVYTSGCAWLLASVVLTGCAASNVGRSSITAPGVFISAEVGAVQIDADTEDNTLEVEEDFASSIQLGLGYQVNPFAAFELRVGDFGTVEFSDERELTYQVGDFTALLMRRRNNVSGFVRVGVGSFNNGGDFDVELESPVHAVLGAGVSYHALPNLDLRFAATSHGSDAIAGSAGLVWRFGRRSSPQPSIATAPADDNDGFEPIAPVVREEPVAPQPEALPAPPRDTSNNGLVIDEKPVPTLQTFPEPVVPDAVTSTLSPTNPTPDGNVTTEPTPPPAAPKAPTLAPETDPVNNLAAPDEKLFVVDTLLSIKPLQFDSGEATLADTSKAEFDEVLDLLVSNPELQLQVESHAAPVGNAELNMLLSRRRALTVIRLLVDEGIDAVRLRPRAFGDTAPLNNVDTIDENDRVEFRVR